MGYFESGIIGYALLALIIGYLLGSINTAYILGRFHKIDIREHGSGNAGSTNTLRTLGAKVAVLNLIGDVLKGLIAVWIGSKLLGGDTSTYPILQHQMLGLIAGFGAVLGHNFPFYLKFRGGKGVATTGAVCLWYSWPMSLVLITIFAIIVALSGYVSLGSVIALALIPFLLVLAPTLLPDSIQPFFHQPVETGIWILFLIACCYSILGIYRHRGNIKRLIQGTENKFSFKKKEE